MLLDRARVCLLRHGYFPEDPRVRKETCALLEEGYEVDVICLRDEGEKPVEVWQGVTIYRLPVRHIRGGIGQYLGEYLNFFLRATVKLGIAHLKRRYSLVQINTMPDFLVFAAILPRLSGTKVLLDLHELMPEFFRAKFKHAILNKVLVRIIAFVERCSVHFAHSAIAVSSVQVKVLQQRKIRRNFTIIHNVPDESLFTTKAGPVQPAAKQHDLVMISHGTVTERYGLHVLVEAVPLILKEVPNLKVYIAGTGEFLPRIKQQVSRLGLSESIIFTGRVPLEAMASYIAQASVGVVPLLEDGYMELAAPNKLFEYVAMEKPVLASDVPGIRAYFDERQVGFFRPGDPEDLANKAIELLKDPQRQAGLASRAREVYETIRWERTKASYKEVIRNLLAPQGINA